MTYAFVTDDTIQSTARSLPNSARRLDTGEWIMGLTTAPPELVAATGWFEIVDTARPANTPTTTFDRSIELIAGVPTVTWTERALTQAELDAAALSSRHATRRSDLEQAVSVLRQWAVDANGTTVTSGNAVQTLQVVIDRLGVFFDRFADLLENQYGEQ